VIGWQIDNETGSYGASNPQVFDEFVERLKKKFGTTDALNKAWFLNYWGQDVNDWSDMPTRDNATSTSYKLEWSRFQQDRVTRLSGVAGDAGSRASQARSVCHAGLWIHDAARCE
jgi:beta-galactosidase